MWRRQRNERWHRRFALLPRCFGVDDRTVPAHIVWLAFYQRRWSAAEGCWLYRRDIFPLTST